MELRRELKDVKYFYTFGAALFIIIVVISAGELGAAPLH